mmetsp:Transcript_70532/g.142025  ORF Transcript_70532/g.142025 Transcript_70532/m.142025 type:complete len:564 (-) Transcript_70532:238-1929(-)
MFGLFGLALFYLGHVQALQESLRILPSFMSNKAAMLPGAYVALTTLSDGQQATLDTCVVEAIVNQGRAVVGFLCSDGTGSSYFGGQQQQESGWAEPITKLRHGGGGRRISISPDRSDKLRSYNPPTAEGGAGEDEGERGKSTTTKLSSSSRFAFDATTLEDGVSYDDPAEVRNRRRALYKPIRSVTGRTLCCLASVTSLTRSSQDGRVMSAALLAFQRCVVTKVEVLEGGALVAQGSDWSAVSDDPDPTMSLVHFMHKAHALAQQCKAAHDECVHLGEALSEAWGDGRMRTFAACQDNNDDDSDSNDGGIDGGVGVGGAFKVGEVQGGVRVSKEADGDDDDDDDDGEDVLVWEEWTSGLVQARGREEAASRELLLVEVRRLVGVLGAGEGRMDLDGGNGGSGGGQGSSSSSSSKMMTRSDMAASKASWESTLWDDSLDSATRRTLKERVLWCGDWLCRVDEEAKVVEITSGGNGGEWGDDDDREWYQALSFVAWQAAAPVASRSDFEQALVTTSTLRRLDQAKRRLETRRGDLAGMLRVLNKDVPPTETPREADTNAEKLPLQ